MSDRPTAADILVVLGTVAYVALIALLIASSGAALPLIILTVLGVFIAAISWDARRRNSI